MATDRQRPACARYKKSLARTLIENTVMILILMVMGYLCLIEITDNLSETVSDSIEHSLKEQAYVSGYQDGYTASKLEKFYGCTDKEVRTDAE